MSSKGCKRKTLRYWSRVISMLPVVALVSESFLGSGSIVWQHSRRRLVLPKKQILTI